jgi:hypothetical protein
MGDEQVREGADALGAPEEQAAIGVQAVVEKWEDALLKVS